MLGAAAAIDGAVVSRTVTANSAEPVFPYSSVDEHVTVVVPIGNTEPDSGEHVTVTGPPPASTAVAVNAAAAPPGEVASTVTSRDVVTTGGGQTYVRLRTADPAFAFPAASVTTAAGTATVTTPGSSGIRVKAYAAPAPENPATVALVTTRALASKPTTGSLKITLTGIGEPVRRLSRGGRDRHRRSGQIRGSPSSVPRCRPSASCRRSSPSPCR